MTLHTLAALRTHAVRAAILAAFPVSPLLPLAAWAQIGDSTIEPAPQEDRHVAGKAGAARTLERVTVTGGRPSTLPVEIPTTTEGIIGAQIERSINASDASDALKYLPSLVVRKRNIGDYDHAVLATRASGTGNSARSLVYADGILLSNLLGNGAEFTPRWGLVSPEEIERVDVLYGPFSAAYSGNSAGAIVDYVTRMPNRLEAHVKLQGFTQKYKLYATDERYSGHQGSASIGSRSGGFSWWLNLNRLDNDGQPLVIARQSLPAGTGSAGVPVTGAIPGLDHFGKPVVNLGSTAQTHTQQDHAKFKLAYDLSPTLRASYTLGYWRNDAERTVDSYLRDASGTTVYSGTVNIDGRDYTLPNNFFTPSRGRFEHLAHGLSLKSNTRGTWDWEATASLYDYRKDEVRSPGTAVAPPASFAGGTGRIVDQSGTGWTTLAAKGIWRPDGPAGAHIAEFGAQRDAFKLRRLESNTPDWIAGGATAATAAFQGDTWLTSLWAQDAWRFAPAWRAVLGGRLERWQADNGRRTVAALTTPYVERDETYFSPKAAVSFQASEDWALKASIGRAVRMPTVNELYQGGINTTTGLPTLNDPNLEPEKSHTTELTAERDLGNGSLRSTLFFERTQDALYTQPTVGGNSVQNIDRVRTAGLELALQATDAGLRGLDVSSSLTYADSKITRNADNPASVGKRQPRVPEWRASLLVSYTLDDHWSGSLGARYSGTQYGQLDNSDTNGFAYQGFSRYFVVDLRLQYRLDRQWRASFGIDNLNNEKYWAFHPYPQRTVIAELRFDL
ncbi:TonB-dependent receptor [Methylibium sp.]|uniref:TonB-dependent receptor n=1 Tax=Methylibium sp. TaxID=2067992 RepID=UPI003D11251D